MANIWDTSNPQKPTAIVDNNSIKDYAQSWVDWLTDSADIIASITIIANTPETGDPPDIVSSSHLAGVVTAFIDFNQCTPGVKQSVTYRIVTAGGRQDDRTFYFKLKAL